MIGAPEANEAHAASFADPADFDVVEEREEEISINMGPQHPSTHGSFRARVRLDGETVVDAEPMIGYVHRGIEKLLEKRTYPQAIPYTDRTDYLSSMCNNHAYVLAVEQLAGIEVPERAEYLRVIADELNRLASHLLAIGTFGLDVGALSPLLYTFREREKIQMLTESLCGARMLYAYMRIGGVGYEVQDDFPRKLEAFLQEMPGRIDEYEELLSGNELFLERTRDVGAITSSEAINYGMTGPNLRATGVAHDLRRADPYAVYDRFAFAIPTGERGDCYDRYLVRIREMRESVKILAQALANLPSAGPVIAKVPKVLKPPAGEAYGHVESPRGEVGCFLVSDGSAQPYRFRWRAASFNHLAALRKLAKGTKVADFVTIFGSIDIIVAEVDR